MPGAMVKCLALDTSGDACSAALVIGDAVSERHQVVPRGHARLLLPMLESLLQEADIGLGDLDGLGFGCGPGSFTGLRIAAAVVQGLAFAADLPVVPVSSLAALAQGAPADRVLAAFDARMGEVYWGAYRRNGNGLVELSGLERVLPPERVALPDGTGWVAVGGGWVAYSEALRRAIGDIPLLDTPLWPHARDVARLALDGLATGRAVEAEQAVPVYLRDQVTHRSN